MITYIHQEEIYCKDAYAFGCAEYTNNFFGKWRPKGTEQNLGNFGKIFVWELQISLFIIANMEKL